MLMDADVGKGGVKNHSKSADVVYGRPLLGHLNDSILNLKS